MPESIRVVGAYTAQPPDPALRRSFVEKILALPGGDGLEIPFGVRTYTEDSDWLWDAVAPGSSHVFTLVGATMGGLKQNPHHGLASAERTGRQAALALADEARSEIVRLAESGYRVAAVEVQSAPGPADGVGRGPEYLLESLSELLAWDWRGATVVIEHCDAVRAGRQPAKGFLELADEIAVVAEARRSGHRTPVGVGINWGRSAIETRSESGPIDHLDACREAGVLAGVVFSGVAYAAGRFGEPWQHSHAMMYDPDPDLGEPTSLLTADAIARSLSVAGTGLVYDGVKVGVRPRDLSSGARVTQVARTLQTMESARFGRDAIR